VKRGAVALTLLLAAPASAQAPVLSPAQAQVCYGWLSLSAKQIASRIYRQAREEQPALRTRGSRVLKCLTGAVEATIEDVREVCLADFAPDALISFRIGNALELCAAQALQGPPTTVLHDAFVTPVPPAS